MYHFVYSIKEISTGRLYIGVKSCDEDPYKCLLKYQSSSKDKMFKKQQDINQDNYEYEILSYYDSRKDAVREEIRLHDLHDVAVNTSYLNRAKQTSTGFDTSGKVTVKDKNNNIFQTSCDDPEYINGNLVSNMKGMCHGIDKDGNIHFISTDDPNYINGTIKHLNHNMVIAKDIHGKIYWITKDDPRYLSGELVANNKGIKLSKEVREKMSKSLKGKFSGENNPFYGKTHSDESRKKISEAGKGRFCSEETKLKRSNALKGQKRSPEVCQRMKDNPAAAKKVCINGIIYNSIRSASDALNESYKVITRKLKDQCNKEYTYMTIK